MTVIGILAFIFILGAAVVLHEFGHFIVAKLLGIRVETFSVGFGPRLFGRKWGQTDYRVSEATSRTRPSKAQALRTSPSQRCSISDHAGSEFLLRLPGR
jgi:hypothetical protein